MISPSSVDERQVILVAAGCGIPAHPARARAMTELCLEEALHQLQLTAVAGFGSVPLVLRYRVRERKASG